jgi:PAS domain S-box-containing protein
LKRDLQGKIAELILREEIQGEKFIYYLRWILILFQIVSLLFLVLSETYLPGSYYALGFFFFMALYNLFLLVVFRKNRYRSAIKYISVFLDTAVISLALYVGSVTTTTHAPVTSALIFLYLIVMVGSVLRLRKLHALYTTVLVLLAFNLVYLLRYPAFSGVPGIEQFSRAAIMEQIFKSFYMLFLGFVLYHIIVMLQRFVEDVVMSLNLMREREGVVQRRYEEIINGIGDGIVVTNESGKIFLVNPAFETLTGYSSEQLLHGGLGLLFQTAGLQTEFGAGRHLDKAGERDIVTFESRVRQKDGTHIPVEISVSRSRISGDWVQLATVRDIRKRKKLERQLIRSHKIETMGRLACGFAHDFNNLITVMGENIYRAKDENNPGRIKEYLCNNESIVERAKGLIEQILVFSTGGTGIWQHTSVPVMMGKIENLLLNVIPPHIELKLTNETHDGGLFRASETGIVQILFNLIINARDAIGKEQGTIEVRARLEGTGDFICPILTPRGGRDSRYIVFSVLDDGTGIHPDIIDQVFEPCFTTKLEGPVIGNGLGLAIVHTIVENLGGGIDVDTAVGKGTKISVYLPFERVGKKEGLREGREKRIVFVDDDVDVRLIGKRLLEKRGYKVSVAENGESALGILGREERQDLLIIDYHMPGLQGQRLIEKITEHSSIPIILLTGDVTDEVDNLSGNERIIDIIRKPLNVDLFLDTVDTAVG